MMVVLRWYPCSVTNVGHTTTHSTNGTNQTPTTLKHTYDDAEEKKEEEEEEEAREVLSSTLLNLWPSGATEFLGGRTENFEELPLVASFSFSHFRLTLFG